MLHEFATHAETGAPMLWSEMMAADAFEAFRETGDPLDPDVARRLEAHVLSRGGSEEGGVLYERVREATPDVSALLRGRGPAA